MNLEMRFGLMNDYDVENVEMWTLNYSHGLWIWNIWDTRFPGFSAVACHHVYQVENSILCWPYDVSVTGHYINSRECYPHWAILIIWEKSMHRLLGMHVGGQSKDNSDLSGWLDNRQMSLISHRTGMHHMHITWITCLCSNWVCLSVFAMLNVYLLPAVVVTFLCLPLSVYLSVKMHDGIGGMEEW